MELANSHMRSNTFELCPLKLFTDPIMNSENFCNNVALMTNYLSSHFIIIQMKIPEILISYFPVIIE